MLIGAALFAIAAFLSRTSHLATWQQFIQLWMIATYGWVALAGFLLYMKQRLVSSSTPFAALLVDVSDQDNRSKLVGIVWSVC